MPGERERRQQVPAAAAAPLARMAPPNPRMPQILGTHGEHGSAVQGLASAAGSEFERGSARVGSEQRQPPANPGTQRLACHQAHRGEVQGPQRRGGTGAPPLRRPGSPVVDAGVVAVLAGEPGLGAVGHQHEEYCNEQPLHSEGCRGGVGR